MVWLPWRGRFLMSMASNVVLLSDQGEPDWIARTRYYNNPADPNDPDDIAVDGNGNVAVAVSGSPSFGIQSYNKYAGLTNLRFNNGIESSGGGKSSPDGKFVHYADGTTKVFYTPTFDDPAGINTWQVYNVFDVDVSDGSLTTFAYGRDSNVQYNDGGYTTMTSAGGDSSGNFYGCGFTRRSGGNEYPYLVKYNSSSVVQWSLVLQPQIATFTGGGVSSANFGSSQEMVSDTSGNTYVSLRHTTDSSDPPTFTIKLMKFNASGVQQWVRVVEDIGTIFSSDGTYLYSAAQATATSVRVVATDVSDGTIAWERTLSFGGGISNTNTRKILIAGGYVYVLVNATNSASNDTNNDGMTWVKMTTSGTVEWNRHIYASGSFSTDYFYPNGAHTGAVVGDKMYTTFRGLENAPTVVKLPLDGSKTGLVGKFPFIGFGGSAPFTYNNYVADINVTTLTITPSTTSTATSVSGTYATTTTTMTTADVDVLSLSVTYDKAGIASALAPSNVYNPVVAYSKRVLR